MTEVWFRNPLAYIRECAELLVPNIAWDRGYLRKKGIDAQRHLEMHYPSAIAYRILLVGDQGTAELRRGCPIDAPFAVYPTWEYDKGTINELEELLDNPVGLRESVCKDPHTKPDERPVLGQEHRVVISRYPESQSSVGRSFLRTLVELQHEYPEAIIHLHGAYSFRVAFGTGLASADIEPRADASKGRIMLANGKVIRQEEGPKFAQWIRLTGYTQGDLAVPRLRCMFNIKSAVWAGAHFDEMLKFKTTGTSKVDPTAIEHKPAETTSHRTSSTPALSTDKFTCDTCSLASSCKYFRDGGVCTLPSTETGDLARLFKTRDSGQIIEGLGRLMEMQVDRAQQGVADEALMGELDPEVTRILNASFVNGVKLAKLVDPTLAAAGATRVGVFINQGGVTGATTPNGLMATVVAELEAEGIQRSEITAAMIADFIGRKQAKAIEATSSE